MRRGEAGAGLRLRRRARASGRKGPAPPCSAVGWMALAGEQRWERLSCCPAPCGPLPSSASASPALSHRLRGCRACREVRGGSFSLGAENEMVMFGFWSGSAAEQRPRHPRSSAGRRCCLLGTAPGYTNTAWCLLKKLVQEVRTD